MLCSKLHCQKGFNLIIFSYDIESDLLAGLGGLGDHVIHLSLLLRQILPQEGRYKATWKRGCKLPWRKAGPLKTFSMIKWIRTSRLSIKNSLFCHTVEYDPFIKS